MISVSLLQGVNILVGCACLELGELLHELLLLFAVAERRQDVKEHLEQL